MNKEKHFKKSCFLQKSCLEQAQCSEDDLYRLGKQKWTHLNTATSLQETENVWIGL